MSRFFGRRVLVALLPALLAAGLVATPAQASPRSPDPELPVVVAPGPVTAGSARKAPATIDSDVDASVTSPSFRAYFVVAGRLKLQLKSGSTTKYTGSLVDYVGNKSYSASADATNPTAPKLKLKSKNGSFEFVMTSSFGSTFYSGTGTKIPAKLKVDADQVYIGATTHSARSASYAITLTERSGPINNPFEYVGTLTLVYDANYRISGGSVTVSNSKGKNVTHSLSSSGNSSSGYFYTVAKVDGTSMGLTGTVSGTSLTGYAFGGSGSKTSQWVLNGTTA